MIRKQEKKIRSGEVMKLTRNVIKNDEGGVDATWRLNGEETSYLINYAIADLIEKGLATIEDVPLDTIDPVGGMQ
jgi:hypothetical protein